MIFLNDKTNQKKKTGSTILSVMLIAVLVFAGVKISRKPELLEQAKSSIASIFDNSSIGTQATEEQYNSVKIGMTMEEVKACLGDNVMLTRSGADTYIFVVKYANRKEDTATLIFNSDNLVQKELFSQQRSLAQ